MTSAFCMSNDNQPARARPDVGGGGGLRGDPAVLLPLPAPSQPLIPSVDQGVSSPTGGGAHMGGALPGTSATLVANLPSQWTRDRYGGFLLSNIYSQMALANISCCTSK